LKKGSESLKSSSKSNKKEQSKNSSRKNHQMKRKLMVSQKKIKLMNWWTWKHWNKDNRNKRCNIWL